MPTSLLSPRLYAPATKPPWGSRIDPAHPLTRQLIGAWALNEGGGALVNAVNGSISPLQTGQTRGITPIMPGVRSNAATAIVLTHAPLNPAAGTVVFLVNFEANVAASTQSNLFSAVSGDGLAIIQDGYNGGKIRGLLWRGGGTENDVLYENSAPIPNTLYHVVFTYTWTGTTYNLACFINGAADNTGTGGTAQFASGTTSHNFLASANGSIPDVYDVKIYNRVLTTGEIAWLYKEPWAMFRQDRQQFWMPKGPSGTTVTKDVTSSAAVATVRTTDVTSSGAVKTTVTKDVTSAGAVSIVHTKDVTSSGAVARTLTKDVTSAAAVKTTRTTDVASTAAIKTTRTLDLTTTAAISRTGGATRQAVNLGMV